MDLDVCTYVYISTIKPNINFLGTQAELKSIEIHLAPDKGWKSIFGISKNPAILAMSS